MKTYLRSVFDKYGIDSRVTLIAANGRNSGGVSLNTLDEDRQVAASCPNQVCLVDDGNNGDY